MRADDSADELVIDFMPALIVLLRHAEEQKGAALTEAEVLEIRDGAVCARVPRHVADATAESRGFADLDPENAWAEWCEVRAEFGWDQEFD